MENFKGQLLASILLNPYKMRIWQFSWKIKKMQQMQAMIGGCLLFLMSIFPGLGIGWGSPGCTPCITHWIAIPPSLFSQVIWHLLFIWEVSKWKPALDEEQGDNHLNVTEYSHEQWWVSFASGDLETPPRSIALSGILAGVVHGERRLATLEKPHKKKEKKRCSEPSSLSTSG